MLRQRVVTAVVLASCFLATLFGLSSTLFALVIGLALGVGGWEWSSLAGFTSRSARLAYTAALLFCLVLIAYWIDFDESSLFSARVHSTLLWACGWWALALLWVQSYPSSALLWGRRWLCALIGFAVLVPMWVAMATLVHAPEGPWLVLGVVALVALADIGAFFSGRAFGRRKLAVQVSPGKTWEGVVGGLGAVALGVTLFAYSQLNELSQFWAWLLLAGVTGLASVLGDLLESMIKRHRGVKDSGTILPGHGGILDRVDGLTAALPVFTLMYALLYARLS